jgi:5'(3')-deoxyribonucleotidase
VPFSKNVAKYERIGRVVVDQQNAFTDSSDEVRAPVNDLVWNKDELNLSVRFTIKGTVELNARAAKANGLPQSYPAVRYNTHTFVKDGNKNIEKAEFLLSQDLENVLNLAGLKYTIINQEMHGDSQVLFTRVLVDFSKIPVINRTYIDNSDSLDDLHAKVVQMTELEAATKVLNAKLDDLYSSKPTTSGLHIISFSLEESPEFALYLEKTFLMTERIKLLSTGPSNELNDLLGRPNTYSSVLSTDCSPKSSQQERRRVFGKFFLLSSPFNITARPAENPPRRGLSSAICEQTQSHYPSTSPKPAESFSNFKFHSTVKNSIIVCLRKV